MNETDDPFLTPAESGAEPEGRQDSAVAAAFLWVSGFLIVRGLIAVPFIAFRGEVGSFASLFASALALVGGVGLLLGGSGRLVGVAALLFFSFRFTVATLTNPALAPGLFMLGVVGATVLSIYGRGARVLSRPFSERIRQLRIGAVLSPISSVYLILFLWSGINAVTTILRMASSLAAP